MAKIYGVELSNVNFSGGLDDYRVEAIIKIEGQKVGLFLDDGLGGNSIIKYDCDEKIKSKFYCVVWRYFASYPEIDTLALLEFTKKEFAELKSNLPKVNYKEWPDEMVAVFFIEKLLYMYQIEEQYINAIDEGYKAIIVASFFCLKNIKAEQDRLFFTDGTIEQTDQIIRMIEDKGNNYIIKQYSDINDFEIR